MSMKLFRNQKINHIFRVPFASLKKCLRLFKCGFKFQLWICPGGTVSTYAQRELRIVVGKIKYFSCAVVSMSYCLFILVDEFRSVKAPKVRVNPFSKFFILQMHVEKEALNSASVFINHYVISDRVKKPDGVKSSVIQWEIPFAPFIIYLQSGSRSSRRLLAFHQSARLRQ